MATQLTADLPLALKVLDQAAQARALDLAQQAGTDHTTAELVAALAVVQSSEPTALASVGQAVPSEFEFGWKRPRSVAERQRRQAIRGWHRWVNQACDRWDGPAVAFLIWGIGWVVIGALAACAGTVLGMPAPIAWSALGLAGGFLPGLVTSWAVGCHLEQCEERAKRVADFEEELPQPASSYLGYPSTRAYLAAVLASPLPDLMRADAERLGQLYDAEVAQVQQKKADATAQATAQARAQRRQARMTEFADGLKVS